MQNPKRVSTLSMLLIGVLVLAACERDPVESELVGTWQAAIASPTGPWTVRFTTLSNGQYRTEYLGPFMVPVETGYFQANNGEWRAEKLAGGIQEGTYQFLADGSLLFQSAAGSVVWTRVADAGAVAATSGDPFASGTPQRVAPALPGPGANTDLASAGPFGAPPVPQGTSPLSGAQTTDPAQPFAGPAAAQAIGQPFAPAAATMATQSPGAQQAASRVPLPPGLPLPPMPLGRPKAAPSPVFETQATSTSTSTEAAVTARTDSAAASRSETPQEIDSAVAGVQQQLESNAQTLSDLPEQAVDDLQRSAEQAAAEAITTATTPVSEVTDEATQKVGQRIQKFTGNTASRVRNFFTGRGRINDDEDTEDR